MPMKSKKQRGWLHKFRPDLAEEFENKTPKGKKLPKKVRRKKKKG